MSYTINPNAKNKWARNAENTMDLSLETDASSVYLDNGRTLEQELGEGSMVSNVATINSSMSKVIDGTLDGAYESCVFKGKSLVNLFDKNQLSLNHPSYSINSDNTITFIANDGYVNGVKLNHLKPNTKYALFFDVLATPQDPDIPYRINDDGTNYNINIFGAGQNNPTSGFHSFTTGSEVWDLKFIIYTNLRNVGFKLTLPIIIEYQEGMENWNIPYFEGFCNVKMPILRNVGKNLFDGELEYGEINMSGTNNGSATNRHRSVNFISVKPDTQYAYSANIGETSCNWAWYDKDKNLISRPYQKTATSPSNARYLRYFSGMPNGTDLAKLNIQIEESPTATSYEDYKTNILHTPEAVTLRSLPNGVRDELDLKTGEYVQRIGEVVLDGSESWSVNNSNNEGFYSASTTTYVGKPKGAIISDKLPTITTTKAEGVMMGVSTGKIMVSFNRDSTGVSNINSFVEKLAQNPITVQYELATPITTTIEPLSIPFTYENGHIVLESGYEGQSLLPTLEYSTVINRTGLIQSIANTVQKQEKQITKLEQMLIQNIVDLDYNNTLLTLKNEMEEML